MAHFLRSLRLLMMIPAIIMLVGSLVMFGLAAQKIASAIGGLSTEAWTASEITAAVMSAADASLFGIVLIIFACAISFGFAIQLMPQARQKLPEWMRPNGIGELKHTLVEVILVYLTVDFATDFASDHKPDWLMLVKPASILLLAAVLRLMGWSHQSHRQSGQTEADAA